MNKYYEDVTKTITVREYNLQAIKEDINKFLEEKSYQIICVDVFKSTKSGGITCTLYDEDDYEFDENFEYEKYPELESFLTGLSEEVGLRISPPYYYFPK